jgi:DNA-binding IclR family transcriptional regulator
MSVVSTPPAETPPRAPQAHRTIDRVTRILEEVVYNPGMPFAELVRAVDAPKSSVYGFIRGLLAAGWLYEDNHRFYMGPAVYALTLASGHLRAGSVTDADLAELHAATGETVFLGVRAGDNLIYVAEAGADTLTGYFASTNIRSALLETAGGKALLAAAPEAERNAYLRRRDPGEKALVEQFLAEYEHIRSTRIAANTRHAGTRSAIATTVRNRSGEAVAEVTVVGPTDSIAPRVEELSRILLQHVDSWQTRSTSPRGTTQRRAS